MGKMLYKPGQIVITKKSLDHDPGCEHQVGVVKDAYQAGFMIDDQPCYYVVVYSSRSKRFWSCLFKEDEISGVSGTIEEMIDSYAYWLSDSCWRNTSHERFNNFMKTLKKIRKKYKKNVGERCDV